MELKKTMKLFEPFVALNGKTYTELNLDFGAVRGRDYALISRIEKTLKGDGADLSFSSVSKQACPEFRAGLTWVAAMRGTKGLCLDDMNSLSLRDLLELEGESISFFLAKASETSSPVPAAKRETWDS
jgi:hypothetical protein